MRKTQKQAEKGGRKERLGVTLHMTMRRGEDNSQNEGWRRRDRQSTAEKMLEKHLR